MVDGNRARHRDPHFGHLAEHQGQLMPGNNPIASNTAIAVDLLNTDRLQQSW